MYQIKDQDIDFIVRDLSDRGITTEAIRDNLLDHICCLIESEMPTTGNFETFYLETLPRFYTHSLQEIETETQDLLTFKHFHAMKRTLKISGGISALFILVGLILKAQHILGGGIILFLGLAIFSLVFIPFNIFLKYREDKNKANPLVMTLGLVNTAIITIGILFKVMHWPSANILIQGGLGLFLIVVVPIYFFSRYKDPDTKFNAIIHSIFMIAGVGMIFALLYANPMPPKHVEKAKTELSPCE